MKSFSRLLLALCLLAPVSIHAWDPDDETFDPGVTWVVVDGATRLGDPSPFFREGFKERGFTYVGVTEHEDGEVTVNLTLNVQPREGDSDADPGVALFAPVAAARGLADALLKGPDLSGEHFIVEDRWMATWTLAPDSEKGLVITRRMEGQEAKFYFTVPAAKKLAGALTHSIESLAAAE